MYIWSGQSLRKEKILGNLVKFSGNFGWLNWFLEDEYKGTKTIE
jgi:hypothetical protein